MRTLCFKVTMCTTRIASMKRLHGRPSSRTLKISFRNHNTQNMQRVSFNRVLNNIILSETRSSQYAQNIEFIEDIDMRGALYGDCILPSMAFCSRASMFTFLVRSVGFVEDLLFCCLEPMKTCDDLHAQRLELMECDSKTNELHDWRYCCIT